MIQFIEDEHASYAYRTKKNAQLADVTLAFAVDFQTSGERLTEESARKYQKGYYAIDIKDSKNVDVFLEKHGDELQKYHSFNIAGNGLVRLKQYDITQQECDKIVLFVLQRLIQEYKVNITKIRSGGQSGADESGLKAAEKLGIDAVCLLPNRWRFNNGKEEIENEILFKSRFIEKEPMEHIKNIEEIYTREEFALAARIRNTYYSDYAPVALCAESDICSKKSVTSGCAGGPEAHTLKMWYAIQVWSKAVDNIKYSGRYHRHAFTIEWEDTKPFRTLKYTNSLHWDYARITEELRKEIIKVADSGEIRVCGGTIYGCNSDKEIDFYNKIRIYDADVLPDLLSAKIPEPTASDSRSFSWNEIQDFFVDVPFRVQELIHGRHLNPIYNIFEIKEKSLLNALACSSVNFDEVRYAVDILHCDVNEPYGLDCENDALRGLTALNLCFMWVKKNDRRKFVDYLLSRGADINFFGYGGHSVLDDAYYCKDYEMLKYLLERGANPNFNGNLDVWEHYKFSYFSKIQSHILYMVEWDCNPQEERKYSRCWTEKIDFEIYPSLEVHQAREIRDLLIKHGAKMFVDEIDSK